MKKIFLSFLLSWGMCQAQQLGDPDFNPQIENPAYETGEGSLIFIDESHNNFHTMSGRYKPFADLLIKDGYAVKPFTNKFTPDELIKADILVISNALNEKNLGNWTLPTPSAFTDSEIENIINWVNEGGSLFLIADHMPFPGAAEKLADRFGFKMNNGFAIDTGNYGNHDLFTRKDGTLTDNFITNGRNDSEKVDSIYSFTGQAFIIPGDADAVLVLNENFVSLMPDTAWNFNSATPEIPVKGWNQGAVKKFGKGKVAVWGEAAMFTAQVAGQHSNRIGMNAPEAKYNYRLLLNIIHWLDGLMDSE